jgi:hypothetical protein
VTSPLLMRKSQRISSSRASTRSRKSDLEHGGELHRPTFLSAQSRSRSSIRGGSATGQRMVRFGSRTMVESAVSPTNPGFDRPFVHNNEKRSLDPNRRYWNRSDSPKLHPRQVTHIGRGMRLVTTTRGGSPRASAAGRAASQQIDWRRLASHLHHRFPWIRFRSRTRPPTSSRVLSPTDRPGPSEGRPSSGSRRISRTSSWSESTSTSSVRPCACPF